MTAPVLAPFQMAAVEHITRRLTDRAGSRRFLLADEVGLGKTIVASGVIDKLASRKEKKTSDPLRVIYLCSNAEIAEQNRKKLDPQANQPIGRVTELAFSRSSAQRRVLLYSFTPGTSLREGTGMAWERRMMLYLVYRIFGIDVASRRWREFFRCTAGDAKWQEETTPTALDAEFGRQTMKRFQDELGRGWRALEDKRGRLVHALTEDVHGFDRDDADLRWKRNVRVAAMRGVMQRVALRAVDPELVILDEVQRFRDVLAEADESQNMASELFREGAPTLILSATPYRLLTLDHEAGESLSDSHKDFFETLRFLCGRDTETPSRVRTNLDLFRAQLHAGVFVTKKDEELLRIKRSLEEDLRKVVARTERSWYVLDTHHGVTERRGSSPLPARQEIEEFLWIHRGIGSEVRAGGLVTEFWKSSPSILTFLDANYALLRRLRDDKVQVPRQLLTPPTEFADLADRHHRLRYLVEQALGAGEPPLWTAPTYRYHQDEIAAHGAESGAREAPRKLLVFSGWRFVPKVIAIVLSRIAQDRLGGEPAERVQPLTFSDKSSFHVFDVCFPSPILASVVNPRAPVEGRGAGEASAEEALEAVVERLRPVLATAGVRVGPVGAAPLWQVVARMERRCGDVKRMAAALAAWTGGDDDELTENVVRHRDEFRGWLDDDGELTLSEMRVRRLALIAMYSPAIAVLRALRSVYGAQVEAELASLMTLTLGPMRRYFNRPLVQQAIRRHDPRVRWRSSHRDDYGYAERALFYACDEHLQAVLDEHVYLLHHAAQCGEVEEAIDHFAAVWSLSRGSRRTNARRGRGARVVIDADAEGHPTHYALAFGDDVSRDAGPGEDAGATLRKTVVREAFNSPFWPFVLATTSVGQEGLDFHLYCRDIHHWNLPSNPVDLEQREGRINRRDCLAVRASIAQDWPLSRIGDDLRSVDANPWAIVFRRLEAEESEQRYKHGLYPHWLYECADRARTIRIERHVTFFTASRDARQYQRLKTGLALYRLVFGQARQEDLLTDLEQQLGELTDQQRDEVIRRLRGYMLSLSPIGPDQARRFAEEEAREILKNRVRMERLLSDVRRLRERHADELGVVAAELDALEALALAFGEDAKQVERAPAPVGMPRPRVLAAVTALAYLRNPYDYIFDQQGDGGFDDDIEVIRETAARLD